MASAQAATKFLGSNWPLCKKSSSEPCKTIFTLTMSPITAFTADSTRYEVKICYGLGQNLNGRNRRSTITQNLRLIKRYLQPISHNQVNISENFRTEIQLERCNSEGIQHEPVTASHIMNKTNETSDLPLTIQMIKTTVQPNVTTRRWLSSSTFNFPQDCDKSHKS